MIGTQPLLDGRARPPLYRQVAERIANLIEVGTLRPGERVPSIRSLRRRQGISVATALHAYQLLESQGLVEARPQSGYYVRTRRWVLPPEPEMWRPEPGANAVNVGELVLEIVRGTADPSLVQLGLALPGPQLIPTAKLNRTMAAIGRRAPSRSERCDILPGCPELRVQVARLAVDHGCTLSPEDVVTTVGGQEAIHLCLRAVARPGDTIAIESPTFFGILEAIEAAGMQACEIPTYPREGVCLDELTERLESCRIRACLFALNCGNPLGYTMPDAKKARLVGILAERGIPLIEDDVHGDLFFGPERPHTAKAYDRQGLVLLCGSFSKTLAPAYRVGWVAPGRFRSQLELLKFASTAATPTLPQLAIAEFLAAGGYERHVRRIRRAYAEQVQRYGEAVGRCFPDGTKVTRPSGGSVLWIELPVEVDAFELYRRALQERISIAPGPLFSPVRRFRNFIRLSCGQGWSDRVEQALKTLGRLAGQLRTRN